MSKITPLLLILLLPILVACSPVADDHFVINRAGAYMPVWIHGDLDTDSYLVVVNGAMTTGRIYHWFDAFRKLEQDYAVVYWDPRGAGLAEGNPADSTMNLDNFIADTDLLLDTLWARHQPKNIILVSHSFGGAVASGYLLEAQRRAKVSAHVDVAGVRSYRELYTIVRGIMLQYAAAILADDSRDESYHAHWRDIETWYQQHTSHPKSGTSASTTHYKYTKSLYKEWNYDADAHNKKLAEDMNSAGFDDTISGPFNPFSFAYNSQHFTENFDFDKVDNSVDDLAVIDIPTLIIAGEYDAGVPPDFAVTTYNSIGTAATDKHFSVYPGADHFVMYDDAERFYNEVRQLVEDL